MTTQAYIAQNTKPSALLACLAQPTYPIPARCGTDTAEPGAFEPPRDNGARTKLFDLEFQFRESHTEAETKNIFWPNPRKMKDHIYILVCNGLYPYALYRDVCLGGR